MHLKPIEISQFIVKANDLWAEQWFLLSAGDFIKRDFNAMTVSWGSLGEIWHKPLAQIFVRPTRFTFQFIENTDGFTLTFYEEKYRDALNLCGTKSGRDCDKVAEASLTPHFTELGYPAFTAAR